MQGTMPGVHTGEEDRAPAWMETSRGGQDSTMVESITCTAYVWGKYIRSWCG